MSAHILIADDNADVLAPSLGPVLKSFGIFEIAQATSPLSCIELLPKLPWAVVLLDISFSHGQKEGLELISKVRTLAPDAELIMLTSFDDGATISQCMALGAHDFISKNDLNSIQEMSGRISAALTRKSSRASHSQDGEDLAKSVGANFSSEIMRDVFSQVAKVRKQPKMHVLITGPTGSGKELIARAISRETEGAPYFPVNSSCFGKDLLESELFGHERGAFTGAERLKRGFFELAHGGDIFFDEVATLSLDHQAKLLRVLQSGEFFRTGGTALHKTSARVIAATNEDLEQMVKRGLFREDLLQRLKRYHIELPSLKDRKEDIPVIVNSIIQHSKRPGLKITSDCLNLLSSYHWPRNVRELEDYVSAMIMNSDGNYLTVGDLPRKFFDQGSEKLAVESGGELQSFLYRQDWGAGIAEAQKRFVAEYILASAKRLRPPLSVAKLAKAMSMPKSSLGKKLVEFGIDLSTIHLAVNADARSQA